jgi:hypothetical protein
MPNDLSGTQAPLSIGGLPLANPLNQAPTGSFILWSEIGVGKTPLACTAPPPVLFLMFDFGGDRSIRQVKSRYEMFDFSSHGEEVTKEFFSLSTKTMQDLDNILATGQFKTLVFDSVTSFMDKALAFGVSETAKGVTKGIKPTLLAPQLGGWGARGTLTRYAVMNLHTLCRRHNVNYIITAHIKNEYSGSGDEMVLQAITMMLGGEAYVQVPKHFGEVWAMEAKDGVRFVRVANQGFHKPCRTRMFQVNPGQYRFIWDFNPYKWEGEGIETWLNRWQENEQAPIPLPKDPKR